MPRKEKCPFCASSLKLFTTEFDYRFQYGADSSFVYLRAVIPVRRCGICTSEWTDSEGQDIVDTAIRAYKEGGESPT